MRSVPFRAGSVGLSICGLLALVACSKVPTDALVVTQVPVTHTDAASGGRLDERYPPGSRVVMLTPPYRPESLRVLSRDFIAAGSPVVTADARQIYFVGKRHAQDSWQIYEVSAGADRPRQITSIAGGACDPAILGNGDLVFSSPVPGMGQDTRENTPVLYAQTRSSIPRRLTFGPMAASSPTVLNDGRILFVGTRADREAGSKPVSSLFTMNNDGTELTLFALDHDGIPVVERPRELPGKRVAFVARENARTAFAESVRTARPFTTRTRVFDFTVGECRSIENFEDGSVLACIAPGAQTAASSFAVYRVATNAITLGAPLFADTAWHNVEATRLSARVPPMGHISVIDASKNTGTLLCLNANFTRSGNGTNGPKAKHVRILTDNGGAPRILGEVPVHTDGSFMAQVPADVPLGFEALAANGEVLHRFAPSIWVRPGENRSCIGCHEPNNHSPQNARPIAANTKPSVLQPPSPALAQRIPR